MKTLDPQFKIRMPSDLKTRLEDAADRSGRSLTAEVVQRLQDSFTQPMTVNIPGRGTVALARPEDQIALIRAVLEASREPPEELIDEMEERAHFAAEHTKARNK